MDLRTNEPYWLMKNGLLHTYGVLDTDIDVDVAIMGAGITGALVSYALAKEGMQVAVIDKRHPGMGSTAASTALLQYEIDTPLSILADEVGQDRAQASYRACADAIDAIEAIVEQEGIDADFVPRNSVLYASCDQDVTALRRECVARSEAGLAVRWLEPDELEARFGLSKPGAILSEKAAQVDAYRLTHGLLHLPLPNRAVYDTIPVVAIHTNTEGVRLALANGHTVRAKHLVIACGYESLRFIPFDVGTLSTTYAFVSKPVPDDLLWEGKALIWESQTPYLYVRTTADNRLIAGGRDEQENDPASRANSLAEKVTKLAEDIRRIMPHIPVDVDFGWAGTFGNTEDSLPYIGEIPTMQHTHFVLGFGGNGIVFSQTGAEIVRDYLCGKRHPMAEIYAFSR